MSNKYTCELILNKNLKKEKCSKKYIEKVIKLANGNYDILIKLIYPKIFKFKNEFQKKEYENIYKFFTCLKLIEKYDLNPLKLLNINVPNKPTNKTINRILDELELQYNHNDLLNRLTDKKILNVFPPIYDIKNSIISQFEHTIFIKENGIINLTKNDFY